MFYMSYKANSIEGHRISNKSYSIFTRKSTIINDLFDWQVEQQKIVNEENEENVYVNNLKIIGL